MTRKDYQAIAVIISSLADKYQFDDGRHVVSEVASDLADMMAEDNPRFDRQRFLDACGYQLV
jgi:hypothetical protein